MDPYILHSSLARLKFLRSSSGFHQSQYEFFHDYGRQKRKHLELHQKWPRPGSKSLTQFVAGNTDLVCLEVSDCRENIEAVHYITSQCTRLQALRLFATDPLLPYSEISNLSQLRYLEIQFDTFYREHRDDFLHRLGEVGNLRIWEEWVGCKQTQRLKPCALRGDIVYSLYVLTTVRNLKTDQVSISSYKLSQRFGPRPWPFLMQFKVFSLLSAIIMEKLISTLRPTGGAEKFQTSQQRMQNIRVHLF